MEQPTVSVIVPCLNEEKRILALLDAVYSQSYSRSRMDVTIADGMSSDGTRAVITEFVAGHPDLGIKVVDNLSVNIPSALNRAIAASSGDIVLRLDAHSYPKPDYVELCVADLVAGKGANVGGIWLIQSDSDDWIGRSIAFGASTPLGVGDARYRVGSTAGPVDTVPFGCYYRETLESVGGFNEDLLTNEDYELNTRIRKAGGIIWLDPRIQSVYYARGDYGKLAKQYFRYGFWKTQMLKKYPTTIVWRQALPPLLVLSLLIFSLLALLAPIFAWLFYVEVVLYIIPQLLVSTVAAIKRKDIGLLLGVPIAISVMHLSWGTGFLFGSFRKAGK